MYIPTQETSHLVCFYSAGMGASTISSARVPIGERIAGWAFAHQQVVANSDASLDLGPAAKTLPTALKYALVAPLVDGKHSIGVVALYAADMFDKNHTRMLESAAALFSDSITPDDSTGGLPIQKPLMRVH
jgi:hypothetical protein